MAENLFSSLFSSHSLLLLLFLLFLFYLLLSLLSSFFSFSLFSSFLSFFSSSSFSAHSLPPVSSAGILKNILIKGYQRTDHFYQQSLWCHEYIKKTQKQEITSDIIKKTCQSLENGCVYRLRMPFRGEYGLIVCCDYKLARILLAGSEEKSIPESEKTDLLQTLNMFDGVCNLLT
jgi:hypothetical protein